MRFTMSCGLVACLVLAGAPGAQARHRQHVLASPRVVPPSEDAIELAGIAPPTRRGTIEQTYGDAAIARAQMQRNYPREDAANAATAATVGVPYPCDPRVATPDAYVCRNDPRVRGYGQGYAFTPSYVSSPTVFDQDPGTQTSVMPAITGFFYDVNSARIRSALSGTSAAERRARPRHGPIACRRRLPCSISLEENATDGSCRLSSEASPRSRWPPPSRWRRCRPTRREPRSSRTPARPTHSSSAQATIPDIPKTTACMKDHYAQLSPRCQRAFGDATGGGGDTKQAPASVAGDDAGAPPAVAAAPPPEENGYTAQIRSYCRQGLIDPYTCRNTLSVLQGNQ